ncbi:pentapeptide repeat-containing protein [Paenibacillus oleatilyticus]|uniref:Pentapeptide repeat-containing protein n=1 Tax=Paenibacillus oleatilyticus TaxID=2594886 RepID=A0ABV4UUH8_9BACL
MQQEPLERWLTQEVAPQQEALIKRIGAEVREQAEARMREWIEPFRKLCLRIHAMQETGDKRPIAYIHVSYLRSWLGQGKLMCSLEAYDDTWYLDRSACMELHELPWLYDHLDVYRRKIDEARKSYGADILPLESDRVWMEDVSIAGHYVVSLVRAAASRIVELPEFQRIRRADTFRIRAGEYLDLSEDVWVEVREEKDAATICASLERQDGTLHRYQDWRELDLSGGCYEGTDVAYSHLTGSNLTGSRLNKSVCLGVDFSGSRMRDVDLSQSVLYDANFSHCDLQGANFQEAVGGELLIHEGQVMGTFGVSFAGANLQGANLMFADLEHADFRGADLRGAKIILLEAAKFALSEEQKRQVRWMEEDETGRLVEVRS